MGSKVCTVHPRFANNNDHQPIFAPTHGNARSGAQHRGDLPFSSLTDGVRNDIRLAARLRVHGHVEVGDLTHTTDPADPPH